MASFKVIKTIDQSVSIIAKYSGDSNFNQISDYDYRTQGLTLRVTLVLFPFQMQPKKVAILDTSKFHLKITSFFNIVNDENRIDR